MVQHLHTLHRLGQVLHGQDLVADVSGRAEINEGIFPGGGTHLIQLDLFQRPLAGGRLLGLGGIRREALDEFLQLLDLLFLLPVGFLHLADHQLAGLVPEVIVSGVQLDLPVVDVRDHGADLVQEVTVVRHHDDRVFEVDKELLQPSDGIEIQMVRRLVQKKDVGVSEQGPGKKHLHLQGAVQVLHQRVVVIRLHAETIEQVRRIALGVPAVHRGEFRFQIRRLDAVFVREVLLRVEDLLLLHDIVEALVAHDHRIDNGVIIILEVVLLQEGEALSGGDGDVPVGGVQLSGQDLQEGGFSGPVGADQPVAVPFRKLNVYIFKQRLFADAECNAVCTDHIVVPAFPVMYLSQWGRSTSSGRRFSAGRSETQSARWL